MVEDSSTMILLLFVGRRNLKGPRARSAPKLFQSRSVIKYKKEESKHKNVHAQQNDLDTTESNTKFLQREKIGFLTGHQYYSFLTLKANSDCKNILLPVATSPLVHNKASYEVLSHIIWKKHLHINQESTEVNKLIARLFELLPGCYFFT